MQQPDPLTGVTAENYTALAKAFAQANGGSTVCLVDRTECGVFIPADPRRWGAWRSYLLSLGMPVRFMDAGGAMGRIVSVPAAWPHLFDAKRLRAEDDMAGVKFERGYRPENARYADAARRLAQVRNWRSQRPARTPDEHLAAEEQPIAFRSSDDLRTNAAPPSAELLATLGFGQHETR